MFPPWSLSRWADHEAPSKAAIKDALSPKLSVVDISRLLESQDSEPQAHRSNHHPSSRSPTRPHITAPPSYAGSSLLPTPTSLTGAPVAPPTQLPPVSSFQTGQPHLQSLPPIHHRQSYQAETPAYGPSPIQYYHGPPSAGGYGIHHPPPIYTTLPPIGQPSGVPSIEVRSISVPAKRGAPSSATDASGAAEKKGKWTPDEDQLAIELRRTGMKWDDIAKRLPGRSAISCRLRYQNYSEKRQDWDEEKKNKLARLYNRFKQTMWEIVAKEMGLPWRAIEGIHWDMGREEMASRANVPVFQPHAAATTTTPQRRSPPGSRPNPLLAPAPTPPSDSAGDLIFTGQPSRLMRARSASAGTHPTSRKRDATTFLASVSEGEQPRSGSNDPSPTYTSEIPNTPASSNDWNGSPASRPTADERHVLRTPPHLRRRTSSHHSIEAPLSRHFQHGPPPPPSTAAREV